MPVTNNGLIRIGVLGATGYIGTPYRAEIRESAGAEIVALCGRRRNLLEDAARLDGATVVTDEWMKVVASPEVDLVIVATPDALHHEAVMACAQNKKHVLCEKPVGTNAIEAGQMWDAYKEAQKLAHFVPFWTRYAGIFVRAKEVVSEGRIGDVRAVAYRWQNPRPSSMPLTWRDDPNLSSAGTLADVGSHAYDTVRWILGIEARRVLCHADTITPGKSYLGEINLSEALDLGKQQSSAAGEQRKGGTSDYANVSCEFDNGAVGFFLLSHATYLRKGLAPELELHGTEGSLEIDRLAGDLTLVRPDGSKELIASIPDQGFGNRFSNYVFPAIRAFLKGAKDLDYPDLEDGWRVQLFTDAAALSARQGRWVELGRV